MTGERTKRIAILGSTGSIGTQALDVIRRNRDQFSAEVLTAWSNHRLLISQAMEWIPNAVVIGDESKYEEVRNALSGFPVKVFAGEAAICQVTEMDTVDLVLNAMVGYSGLKPTLAAVEAGKHVALANKESLVVAGDLVMRKSRENRVMILPVDSEHSAIFQCLLGEAPQTVEKIFLTASGGPFRGKSRSELMQVTPGAALVHPNWKMGSKITVDSASLMNKGLEVIEAHWLFSLKPEQIEVVIHPQSVVHSMVQYIDGSIKAQLGIPDMRLPIHFALAFPQRISSDFRRFSFAEYSELTFENPDTELFRNLSLACEAMKMGGNMPCVLNSANESAVGAFLEERISFLEMSDLIEHCLGKINRIGTPSYEDYVTSHEETRRMAERFIGSVKSKVII